MCDTREEIRLDRAIEIYGWCRACHNLRPSCVCPENPDDPCRECGWRGYHRDGCALESEES